MWENFIGMKYINKIKRGGRILGITDAAQRVE